MKRFFSRLSKSNPRISTALEPDAGEPVKGCADAVYVAGNAGIFFPALVALTSIEKHNPGRYDLFMIFDGGDLTPSMAETLAKYGVKFISAHDVPAYERVLAMKPMKGKWPVEIFLNWAMPEHFSKLGYRYAFKADYDLLCVAPWKEIEEFLPSEAVFTALKTREGRSIIPAEGAARVLKETGIDCLHPHSINAGFVIFNAKLASDVAFFDTFNRVYSVLVEDSPDVGLLEQVVVAIVGHGTAYGVKRLPKSYNQRTRIFPTLKNSGPVLRNIHYLSRYKPWLPHPDIEAALAARNRCILPFYRTFWLEHASTLEGFSDFTDQRPYTASETLDLATRALVATIRARAAPSL